MLSHNDSECGVMSEAAEEVKGIVTGSRNICYGTPSENHDCTAAMWSAFLSRLFGFEIILDGADVCWMNVLQKASREAHWAKRDNAIDAAGYALNAIACNWAYQQDEEVSIQENKDETLRDDPNKTLSEVCSPHPDELEGNQGCDLESIARRVFGVSLRGQRVPSEKPEAN